jgi:hypothetical protein
VKFEFIQGGGERRVEWGTRMTIWSSWGAILGGLFGGEEQAWVDWACRALL